MALRALEAGAIPLGGQAVVVGAPAPAPRPRVVARDARGARGPAVKVAVAGVEVGADVRRRPTPRRDGVLAAEVVVPRAGRDRGRPDDVGRTIPVPGGA